MLRARDQPHERVALESVGAISGAHREEGLPRRPGRARERPDQAVVPVAPLRLRQVRAGARVRPRRPRRGRWREELEHAQRLGSVGEPVVPGVLAEEHALPGLDPDDLAGLGVRERQRPLEDVEHLVGAEHRPEVLRVPEAAARLHPEHDRVEQPARDVQPVLDVAGDRIAPGVARDLCERQRRRTVERRSWRRLIAHCGCGGRGSGAPPRRRAASARTRAPGTRWRSRGRLRRGRRPARRA